MLRAKFPHPQELSLPDPAAGREEVELWREEVAVARAEASDTRRRLESQEESVAAVLHQTAEVSLSSLFFTCDTCSLLQWHAARVHMIIDGCVKPGWTA